MDTNILIYASNGRKDAPEKHAISQGLLTTDFGLSGQVLAEFYVNAQKKGDVPLRVDEACEWIDALSQKPCVPIDTAIVRDAIRLSQRFEVSYWDGGILAAARRIGAEILYSEDLSHGQSYESVSVINPFKQLEK